MKISVPENGKRVRMSFRSLASRLFRLVVPRPVSKTDLDTISVAKAVLKKNSNCIDIGSNRGELLAHFIKFAPNGSHWAFEPLPSLFPILHKNFPSVQCRQIALSDQAGIVNFYWFPEFDGFSGLKLRKLKDGINEPLAMEVQVATSRLDDVRDSQIPAHLIKIDVEGAEFRVLRGAEKTLRNHRPVVIFECGKGGLDLFGTKPEEVFDYLAELKFQIKTLRTWKSAKPVTREEFIEYFYAGQDYMFVANAITS